MYLTKMIRYQKKFLFVKHTRLAIKMYFLLKINRLVGLIQIYRDFTSMRPTTNL